MFQVLHSKVNLGKVVNDRICYISASFLDIKRIINNDIDIRCKSNV